MNTYTIPDGKIYNPQGKEIGQGYSGDIEHKNNPARENVPDMGPIVEGLYTISGPFCVKSLKEGETCPDCQGISKHEHGPYIFRLHPDDPTREKILSYNRGPDSFLIHGDSIIAPGTASKGCIIMGVVIRYRIGDIVPSDNVLLVKGVTL